MSSEVHQSEPLASASRAITPPNTQNPEALSINHTPIVSKIAPYSFFAAQPLPLAEVHRRLVRETAGHYVGPMPATQFMDTFMPWNDGSSKLSERKPSKARLVALSAMATASSEKEMYPHFFSALRNWPPKSNETTVRLRFEDSHLYRDRDCQSLGVDICAYPMLKMDHQVARAKPPIMDFANAQTWVEIKPDRSWDPFRDPELSSTAEDTGESEGVVDDDQGTSDEEDEKDDYDDLDVAEEPPNDPRESVVPDDEDVALPQSDAGVPSNADRHPFESNTQRGRHTRGRLASYAGATMSVQFRNHLLTVLICKDTARFIRWDRSCAIVTRAFNYGKNPLLFFEFFARFSQLTREQRGVCPFVRPAKKSEASKARTALESHAVSLWLGKAGKALKKVVSIEAQPFLVFDFKGESFVIPAPHCDESGLSPFGRATRARAAVCLSAADPRVVFLKDYWREPGDADSGVISEAEVYDRFKVNQIKHVATMYLGGDVDGLKTDGRDRATADWVYHAGHLRVPLLIGHCIILNEVGRGLLTFRTARTFIKCLADIVEAYEEILEELKIMHRDLSPDNVMMMWGDPKSQWGGLLIDWDHCIDLTAANARISRAFRTGKWQFLSVALAERRTSVHAPVDDRESVLHSFLWSGLRHLKHGLDTVDLQTFLAAYDEMAVRDGNVVSSGAKRRHVLTTSGLPDIMFDLEPLNTLVGKLCWMFSVRYEDRRNTQWLTPAEVELQNKRDEVRRASLDDPKWLVGVLREAERALWRLQEDRHKEVLAGLREGNNGALDDNKLEGMAWAEMREESDSVNHVLRLESVAEPDVKYTMTRPWDGYTKHSRSDGPLPPDDYAMEEGGNDDEQPQRKKQRI